MERGGASQGPAPAGWVEPIFAQSRLLLAGCGRQRVQPQTLMIVEVFVPQRQPVEAPGQQRPHRVLHVNLWLLFHRRERRT